MSKGQMWKGKNRFTIHTHNGAWHVKDERIGRCVAVINGMGNWTKGTALEIARQLNAQGYVEPFDP